MIQKIYEVDPLTYPQCKGAMKIISVIDQPEIVKHILQHPGLWETQMRSPPSNYCAAQITTYDNINPDYPFEAYI